MQPIWFGFRPLEFDQWWIQLFAVEQRGGVPFQVVLRMEVTTWECSVSVCA